MRLTLIAVLWTAASSFGVYSTFPNQQPSRSRTFGIIQQNQQQPYHQRIGRKGVSFLSASKTVGSVNNAVSTENLALLSPRGRAAVECFMELDAFDGGYHQAHVYQNWPAAGEEDDGKQKLAEQVRRYLLYLFCCVSIYSLSMDGLTWPHSLISYTYYSSPIWMLRIRAD